MSIPIIQKPEDRCPYPVGTKVAYWHWYEPDKAREALRGVVDQIQTDSGHATFHGLADAAEGEKVIRFLDDHGEPVASYDRFLLAPVADHEPQRWFPLESIPTLPDKLFSVAATGNGGIYSVYSVPSKDHLKLFSSFLLAAVFSVVSQAASLGVSVGFPGAPQAPGCSASGAIGNSAACTAANSNSHANVMFSAYGSASTYVVVEGSLQMTQPTGSTTIKATGSATITEFAGHVTNYVTVKNQFNNPDTEPVLVYDSTGSLVATLSGGSSVNIPAANAGSIQIAVLEYSYNFTAPVDYASIFHVQLTAY